MAINDLVDQLPFRVVPIEVEIHFVGCYSFGGVIGK